MPSSAHPRPPREIFARGAAAWLVSSRRLKMLPHSFQAEIVEAAERGQIRRSEGSVEQVEVFRMGSVGTSILEDLDPYPANGTRTLTTPSITKSPFRAMTRSLL